MRLEGTLRAFDPGVRRELHEHVKRVAVAAAASAGAEATVEIELGAAVTGNDPALVARMGATLHRVGGAQVELNTTPTTTAEDFSAFQERVPGMFVFLGVTPPEKDARTAEPGDDDGGRDGREGRDGSEGWGEGKVGGLGAHGVAP